MDLHLLTLFVAIPLGVAVIIPMVGKKFRKLPDILGNLATLALAVLALSLIGHGRSIYWMGGWGVESGVPLGINLVLDGLAVLMLVTVAVVSLMATLFSVRYMELYTSKLRYYSLFLLMVAGMNGVILTGDLFNLYVFLEIASIASYALVGFGCDHEELEASFKYTVLGVIGSTFILLAIGFVYAATGSLNMAQVSQVASSGMSAPLMLAATFFLVGFSLKAALVPFHAWLPDAHPSAPAPISAMLSGVLIKVLGVYALARIFFNVFGVAEMPLLGTVLLWVGTISMVAGALLALGQWDLKRMLAYSSVSQIGFVVLGLGIGAAVLARGGPADVAALAIAGGLFHLVNHAVFKSLLFLASGAIVYSTGTRDLRKMRGLLKRMPVTAVCTNVGALSISGLPPLAGFWSKLIIIWAAVRAGYNGLAVTAVVVSVITLAYYLKALGCGFLGESDDGVQAQGGGCLQEARRLRESGGFREAPGLMLLPMVILALGAIVLGVLWIPQLREAFLVPAQEALTAGVLYAESVLGGL